MKEGTWKDEMSKCQVSGSPARSLIPLAPPLLMYVAPASTVNTMNFARFCYNCLCLNIEFDQFNSISLMFMDSWVYHKHFWEKTWVQCQRMAGIFEVTPEINYSTFVQSNPHQASSIHVCFDSAMWKTKPKHLGHCTTNGTALSAGLLSTCFGCARLGIKCLQGEAKKEITLRQI